MIENNYLRLKTIISIITMESILFLMQDIKKCTKNKVQCAMCEYWKCSRGAFK